MTWPGQLVPTFTFNLWRVPQAVLWCKNTWVELEIIFSRHGHNQASSSKEASCWRRSDSSHLQPFRQRRWPQHTPFPIQVAEPLGVSECLWARHPESPAFGLHWCQSCARSDCDSRVSTCEFEGNGLHWCFCFLYSKLICRQILSTAHKCRG